MNNKYTIKFSDLNPVIPSWKGTIYHTEEFKKAVDAYQQKVKDNTAIGIMFDDQDVVSEETQLHKVSHKINDIFIEEDTLNVDIEILSTPCGELAKKVIDFCDLYVNMTGGIDKDEKGNIVPTSLHINSIDLISFP